MSNEITIKDTNELVSAIDYSKAWEKSMSIIKDLVDIDEDASLTDIEVTKERAQAFITALDNITIVKHYEEILPNLNLSFSRKTELEGLQGLLDSYNISIAIAKKNMNFLMKRMEDVLDYDIDLQEVYEDSSDPEDDEEDKKLKKIKMQLEITSMYQQLYSQSLQNINKAATGLAKVIEIERKSGGRPWGNIGNFSSNKTLQIEDKSDEKKPKATRTIDAGELKEYET